MAALRCGGVLLAIVAILGVQGCTSPPEGVIPVDGFQVERFLGTWYEILRLDHGFERGLSQVTATYSLREDGGIDVVNRGYDEAAGQWREAVGRAYFTGSTSVGSLKVSFFGPFFGGYHVIALDRDNYSHALVSGPTREYLWVLARNPRVAPSELTVLVEHARGLGYATDSLIRVKQDSASATDAGSE